MAQAQSLTPLPGTHLSTTCQEDERFLSPSTMEVTNSNHKTRANTGDTNRQSSNLKNTNSTIFLGFEWTSGDYKLQNVAFSSVLIIKIIIVSDVISTNLEHVIQSKVLKCIFKSILVHMYAYIYMYACIYMYTHTPPPLFGTFPLFIFLTAFDLHTQQTAHTLFLLKQNFIVWNVVEFVVVNVLPNC